MWVKKTAWLLIFFFACHSLSAQVENELERKLANKTRFSNILKIVKAHFKEEAKENKNKKIKTAANTEEEFESDELFWKRWEYYNGLRLDEQGNVTNANQRTWNVATTDARFSASATQRTQNSFGAWTALGPIGYTNSSSGYNGGNGRVACVAFHPTNASIIYAGTPQGGLWRTTNGGSSWANLTDNIPSTGVSGIVVSSADANTVYILTGDGDPSTGGFVLGYGFCKPSIGVLKSTDGGINWLKTTDFPGIAGNTYYGYKLIQHPTNANILYAATSLGIMKTINGGQTWTNTQSGSFTDIEFNPATPATMYAARYNSASPFYRSTNSGDTWSTAGVTGVPTNAVRIAIGVSANNSSQVYFLAGPNTGSGSFVGVYKSTNSGLAFSNTTTTPNILGYPNDGSDNKDQAGYDLSIAINPGNAAQVITGGIDVWKSVNSGTTFTYRTQWNEPTPAGKYVHADIHNLAYNPLDGKLYSCSDGGVGVSSDNGETWSFISTGMQIMAFYHGDGIPTDNNFFCGGAQDNGTDYRKTATSTFTHIYGADGFDAAIDPGNTNIVYYVANQNVLKTTDGGNNATDITPPGMGFFPRLALDPNNSAIVYAADAGGVRKSTSSGGAGSWVNKGAAGGRALTTCPSNSSRIYTSDGTNTYRSDDGGDTWTTLNNKPGYPPGQTLSEIAVSPTNSSAIWAVFGGYSTGNKVFRSTDAGANWTNISGTLPNIPVFTIVADNAANLYIGTDLGVFYRGAGLTDWSYFNNLLPKTPVTALIINVAAGKIKAATFGRGLFEADIHSACLADISFIFNQDGTQFFEASNSITSNISIVGGLGTNVFYRAQNYVALTPGFTAAAGNTFLAYIGGCGAGGVPARINHPTDSLSVAGVVLPVSQQAVSPLGSVVKTGKNNFAVTYKMPGRYVLRICDAAGNVLQVIEDKTVAGWLVENKTISGYTSGLNYLQLFYNNLLVHFSER